MAIDPFLESSNIKLLSLIIAKEMFNNFGVYGNPKSYDANGLGIFSQF